MNFYKPLVISVALSVAVLSAGAQSLPVNDGPYKPTLESLRQYRYPEWFRDAKFGIWAHWGPQAVPRRGDWYARRMYQQGDADYEDHLSRYGHPSQFGYKDIIPLWKAEKWDPDGPLQKSRREILREHGQPS
jgi:alpha-L-fucosidase